MRNFQLETIFTGQDLELDLRIAFRVGGVGGPAPQRGGGAFDGTGHAPSSPGNANVADHSSRTDKPRGKKAEGPVISHGNGNVPGLVAKRKADAAAQAQQGAAMMGTKPHGGLRAV